LASSDNLIKKTEHISTLEGCIDNERQFKTAKRSQAPGDATVLKRFSSITSLFFVVDQKDIIFGISEFLYLWSRDCHKNWKFAYRHMQIFNFRDSHM